MKQTGLIERTLAILIIILTVYLKFGEIIFSLNTTLFALHGDGFRAYYIAKYHILNDINYLHTSALNYPFGEHIIYTDSQPILTGIIKLLMPIVDLSAYTVGIINSLMILGLIFAIIFIILILKNFKVPIWIGALIGAGMVLLSPQTGRFTGHYSLSYMFVIPAIIYSVIAMDNKKYFPSSIWIFLLGMFLAATHMYLFAMYAGTLLIYWTLKVRIHINNNKWTTISAIALQFFLPIVFYAIIMSVTDTVKDRPSYPDGFFLYFSHPAMIFFPMNKPYLTVFNRIISARITWEGYAYISLAITSVFFFLSYQYLKTLFYSKFKQYKSFFGNPTADLLLLIAVLFLLYSFTVPFDLGLQWLLKYTGPLRQIRAVGRFAWVFFYTIIPLSFAWLYKQNFSLKNIKIDRIIFFIALFFFLAESLNNRKADRTLNNKFEAFTEDSTQYDSLFKEIKKEKYQTIYPLPYFYIGPEYLMKNGDYTFIRYNYLLSLKCNIPVAGNFCARTSYSQALKQTEIFKDLLRKPIIFSDYTDKKILIMADTSQELNSFEQKMIQTGIFVGYLETYILLETTKNKIDSISNKIANKNLVYLDSLNFLPIYNQKIDYLNNFDTEQILTSNPLIINNPRKEKMAFKYQLPDSTISNANLYIWLGKIDQDRLLGTDFYIKTYDSKDHILSNIKQTARYQVKSIMDNNALLKFKCENLPKGGKLELSVKNNQFTNQKIYIYNAALSLSEDIIEK